MKKNNVNLNKNIRAENYLTRLLQLTPIGGKLPGMRTLIAESGVGRVRLERALDKLSAEGKLEIRPCSGCYRSSEADNVKRFLLLDLEENDFAPLPSGDTMELFPSFMEQLRKGLEGLCRDNGCEFTMHSLYGDLSRAADFFRNNKFTGCFFRGSSGREVTGLISQYCPVVDLLPHNHDSEYPAVIDSTEMTGIQLDYLLQRGYRRIAYLHQIDKYRLVVQTHRLCDYYRIMSENNIKVEPEWGMYCSYEYEKLARKLHKLMNLPRAPEALIVPGNTVPAIYRFCADNGIAVGRELAIMGCDDLSPELSPRCTSVTNNPAEIAEQAWRVMQAALRCEKLIEYTDLKIVTGESVPVKQQ